MMLSRSLFRVRITAFTIRNGSRLMSTSTSTSATRSKVVGSISEALDTVKMKDGQTVLVGGFGLCGIPMACIQEIQKRGIKDLTVVSNNCGVDKWGLGILLQTKQIRRMISSYVGENAEFERQYFAGELEVELVPQGTLAEKMRAGGAGIPAFFTRTGAGTIIETGGLPIKYGKAEPGAKNRPVEIASAKKETANFDGSHYIMERSIRGDIGLVKAWKADTYGNLVFKGTARNFNPECAMAAKQVIAEVEEIVPIGSIDPHDVHLSGVYVTAVVQANAEKKIERLTVQKDKSTATDTSPEAALRERIVRRAALELKDGMDVNLGIGMPTLASNYLPPSVQVMYQSENGLLGMGPYPIAGQHSPDLINAGKETVTMVPGASLFSSSQSFAMIRGNHIDISILGAMEVSEFGDLANWIIPGKMVKGMGGAMDLVASGSRIVICMEHTNKKKQPKILKKCSLPLTGVRCVNRIITELAVFDVDDKGLILIEHDKNTTIDQIRAVTEPEFRVSSNLKIIEYA